jgi:hypothetical protein
MKCTHILSLLILLVLCHTTPTTPFTTRQPLSASAYFSDLRTILLDLTTKLTTHLSSHRTIMSSHHLALKDSLTSLTTKLNNSSSSFSSFLPVLRDEVERTNKSTDELTGAEDSFGKLAGEFGEMTDEMINSLSSDVLTIESHIKDIEEEIYGISFFLKTLEGMLLELQIKIQLDDMKQEDQQLAETMKALQEGLSYMDDGLRQTMEDVLRSSKDKREKKGKNSGKEKEEGKEWNNVGNWHFLPN